MLLLCSHITFAAHCPLCVWWWLFFYIIQKPRKKNESSRSGIKSSGTIWTCVFDQSSSLHSGLCRISSVLDHRCLIRCHWPPCISVKYIWHTGDHRSTDHGGSLNVLIPQIIEAVVWKENSNEWDIGQKSVAMIVVMRYSIVYIDLLSWMPLKKP